MNYLLILGLLLSIPHSGTMAVESYTKFEAPEIIPPGNPACQSEEYAKKYPDSCKTIGVPNPKYKTPKITVNGVPTHFLQEQLIIDFLKDKTGKNIGFVDLITQ